MPVHRGSSHTRRTISVVATVLNEAGTIDVLLDSLAQQTIAPDQVVIVDGGSTDGTLQRAKLHAHNFRRFLTISLPGSNIAQGRNAGIARSRGDIIAVTDAGVRLDPDWLAKLTEYLQWDPPRYRVAAGFFVADPRNTFEMALACATIPLEDEIVRDMFLPSSRSVAFFREAWAAVRGYPEWLDYCEDIVFDRALKRRGYRIVLILKAIAYYRPRRSVGAFFLQYFRYARGDGKADLWLRRHLVRYAAYLAGSLLMLMAPHAPWTLAILTLGVALHVRKPLARLRQVTLRQPWTRRLLVATLIPPLMVVGDVAKMLGYPVGICWRLFREEGRELG